MASAVRLLVAVVLTVTLAGCGAARSNAGSSDGSGVQHNDADISFATGMVPHHAQGVAMAKLAADRSASPAVKRLALQISAEQVPEIYQMQSMLSDWGSPAADPADTGAMAAMPGMASMDMGMMTGRQMADLTAAKGTAFDRMFLQLMVVHDQGGITMARTEMSGGLNSDATVLAQNIDDAQEYAVPVLQQLLSHPEARR